MHVPLPFLPPSFVSCHVHALFLSAFPHCPSALFRPLLPVSTPCLQGKRVKFSASAEEEGHGTIKRKPTAYVRMRVPVEEEEEEEEEEVRFCLARCVSFWLYSIHRYDI